MVVRGGHCCGLLLPPCRLPQHPPPPCLGLVCNCAYACKEDKFYRCIATSIYTCCVLVIFDYFVLFCMGVLARVCLVYNLFL